MDNIRAIRNDADLAWAIAEVTPYFENEPALGTPEAERFDVLSTLIEAYEDRHHPVTPPDHPIDYLRSFMDETGRGQSDLALLLGSAPRASEVLAKKRVLTLEMIHRLSTEWGLSAAVLVKPYRVETARPRAFNKAS